MFVVERSSTETLDKFLSENGTSGVCLKECISSIIQFRLRGFERAQNGEMDEIRVAMCRRAAAKLNDPSQSVHRLRQQESVPKDV